jgi:hypothetical protein
VKAIETEWHGHRFRSRLEARWAIFFECLAIDWEYENEGFELDDGTRYLPDFLLHGFYGRRGDKNGDLYVEVKGNVANISHEDAHKIQEFSKNAPIYVVGDIPYAGCVAYDKWSKKMADICYQDSEIKPYNFYTVDGDDFGAFIGVDLLGIPRLFGDDSSYLCVSWGWINNIALKVASMARFEHGETPNERMIDSIRCAAKTMRSHGCGIRRGIDTIKHLSIDDEEILCSIADSMMSFVHTLGLSHMGIVVDDNSASIRFGGMSKFSVPVAECKKGDQLLTCRDDQDIDSSIVSYGFYADPIRDSYLRDER